MVKLRDFQGRWVEIPEKIERMISLNPSITEIISLLGMETELKGVSAFCRRPESVEKIRKIGSYSTYNETLVNELEPELILTVSGYQEKLSRQLSEKFNVFEIELPSSPFWILDMVSRLGIILSKTREADKLIKKMLDVATLDEPGFQLIKAYLEIDLGGPVSFGNLSYITKTLNYFNLETPYDQTTKEWLTPDYYEVLNFNPQILIFEGKMYRGIEKEDAKSRISNTPLSRTDAFRDDLIFCTPGKLDFFAHHGPSFFLEVIPWLRSILRNLKI